MHELKEGQTRAPAHLPEQTAPQQLQPPSPTCSLSEEGTLRETWGLAPLSEWQSLPLPPPPSPWQARRDNKSCQNRREPPPGDGRSPTGAAPPAAEPRAEPTARDGAGSSRPAPPSPAAPGLPRPGARPLPGPEGPLASQPQEAAAEQRAAQRRGQGDDSPHDALGSNSHRSYGRPIVFKGGGGEGRRPWQPRGLSAPPLARSPAPPLSALSRLGAAPPGAAGLAPPGALRAHRPFHPASSGGRAAGAGSRHGFCCLGRARGRAVLGVRRGVTGGKRAACPGVRHGRVAVLWYFFVLCTDNTEPALYI